MSSPFDILSEEARERLRESDPPGWADPILAILTEDYLSDEAWIVERKLDGVRLLVFRDGDAPGLAIRNRERPE